MRTDIMCKHDVMNIQHAHCGQSPFARNWYTYMLFSQVLGCMWAQCFHQLGGHVELPWLRCNCANMTSSKKAPTQAGEDRTCISGDAGAQTDTVITILRSPIGVGGKKRQEEHRAAFTEQLSLCVAANT